MLSSSFLSKRARQANDLIASFLFLLPLAWSWTNVLWAKSLCSAPGVSFPFLSLPSPPLPSPPPLYFFFFFAPMIRYDTITLFRHGNSMSYIIDPYNTAAMLSLRRIKSFVFARQASHWIRVWPRLAVRKQSFLFPRDSTWPPSDKGLLSFFSFSPEVFVRFYRLLGKERTAR